MQNMLLITGFSSGSFPVKYLGTPLVFGKTKVCHFNPLVERISIYLKTWSAHSLSYVGRLELQKAVIQGVESFWLQTNLNPSTVLDIIIRICNNFLWAGSKPKVAWNNICYPTEEGGLGLRNCRIWNRAFLFKTLWDIHSQMDSLWIKWIHVFYLRGRSIWTWNPNNADHPMFKNIQKIIDELIHQYGSIIQAQQLLNSWHKNDKFSISHAYNWLRTKGDKKPWMSLIWRRYIPPKFSFILWLAMRGRLNTKDRWINVPQDTKCVFCKLMPESIPHMFFKCTFVSVVWRRIREWLNINKSMSTLLSMVKWIKKNYGGAFIDSKVVVLAFAATIYSIWSFRNQILFAKRNTSVEEILHIIKTLVLTVVYSIYLADVVFL